MHINSTAPQAPAQPKFKVGTFDIEHRISTQHPAGIYRISYNGAFLGSQYSRPNEDDCQRIRSQSSHNQRQAQLAAASRAITKPWGTAQANDIRSRRGGINSKRNARTERSLDAPEES